MNIDNKIKAVDNSASKLVSGSRLAPKLILVSKNQPDSKIQSALDCGSRIFGENRLEQALEHWSDKKEHYPDLELHYIGALQSNKASDVVKFFDAIHSIDRESVAKAVSKAMEKTGKRPDCFIQVNTGGESQKSGVSATGVTDFIDRCVKDYGLPIVGLMCLPPKGLNPVPHFAFLKKLADENGLSHLSMGMSSDWELAVRMGATHIRLGTAIFGDRD